MKTRLAALLILTSFALPPLAAAATAEPVFGLRAVGNPKRGFFVYDLAPGATRSGGVIVSNTGNRAGTVKLYSADGSTGQTTGTVYLTDSKPTRAGSWVKLARSSVRLAPGAIKTVPFTVKVPKGARPGQWVAGIVAETQTAAKTKRSTRKAGVQIRIRNQTIIAVQVNVRGARNASFTIGGAKTGGQRGFQQVLVHFANTGNVLEKPKGMVTILRSGTALQRLPFSMDTFLPQTEIDYPILLEKALAPGKYQTKVSLNFATPSGGRKTVAAAPPLNVSNENVKQVFTSAAPTQQPTGGVVADSGSSTPWALIAAIGVACTAAPARRLAAVSPPAPRRVRRSRSELSAVPPARIEAATMPAPVVPSAPPRRLPSRPSLPFRLCPPADEPAPAEEPPGRPRQSMHRRTAA